MHIAHFRRFLRYEYVGLFGEAAGELIEPADLASGKPSGAGRYGLYSFLLGEFAGGVK
jgi:hypothetical protein